MSTIHERRLKEIALLTRENAKLTAERDALRAEAKKLHAALIDILDEGDWRWSEVDDAAVFSIILSEKDFTKFSDLALAEVVQ